MEKTKCYGLERIEEKIGPEGIMGVDPGSFNPFVEASFGTELHVVS